MVGNNALCNDFAKIIDRRAPFCQDVPETVGFECFNNSLPYNGNMVCDSLFFAVESSGYFPLGIAESGQHPYTLASVG